MNNQEPAAWAVEDERGLQLALHPTAGHARHMAQTYRTDGIEGKVVPLYRQPQPTLTEEEREAVEQAIPDFAAWADDFDAANTHIAALRGLLERTQ